MSNGSTEEAERGYLIQRKIYNQLAFGEIKFENAFPGNMRKYRKESSSPLDIYRMSIWRLLYLINKPIYLETDAWEGEISPLSRMELSSDDSMIQRLVCEGNRKGLLDYVIPWETQSHKEVLLRDSRLDEWLYEQGERKWGTIFGMKHNLKATIKRQDYGVSDIRLPENQERNIITWLLSERTPPIIDSLAPMNLYHAFFNITSHITEDQLAIIWKVLQSNAGKSSLDLFRSQINRIWIELLKFKPNLKTVLNRKYEREFSQVFNISMKEIK